MHAASAQVVKQLRLAGIELLVIGKNEQWKNKINLGSRTNQNFVQIPYEKFIQMVTYKCQSAGIEVKINEESYTSKASFLDWDNIPTYNGEATTKPVFSGKRVQRAWYRASDGTLLHADVNGSYNIGKKVVPTAYSHLKDMVARDRGCLVVHPRRITPRSPGRSAQTQLMKGLGSKA